MSNSNNEFMIKLIALLEKQKSKASINSDIKELEKVLRKIRLVATLSKGSTKTEINQVIKQMEAQLKQIKLQAKIDNRQLNREIGNALRNVTAREIQLNLDSGRVNAQVRRVVSQAREYIDKNPLNLNVSLKKEKLLNQMTTFLNKNTKISESTYWLSEAGRLRTVISSISSRSELRNATDQFAVFTSGVRATGFAALSTTDRIKGMLGKVVQVGNYFGLAYVAVNKFVQSINNLKEMDTIFTEISKTTDLTVQKLEELADRAYSIASRYGVLAKNFATSLQEMSRAGFGDGQAEPLAELATLAQSAGALTSELANEYLIASNAAYGYQGNIEKLNALLDSQNQITNRNAVSMTELAEATKVAANQLSNSNIAENEMTALLGTGIATTKESGSVVGRAVKAIIMNLQQVKNTDEGLETTEEDLGKVESRLESLGIQMKETADGITSLRSPIAILEELSEVYNALPKDSAERANIISDIGGKYRGNVLSSILSNWSAYEKMLSDYEDAEGSALREAQKSADSWEGRLAQLQNSWDSFVSSLTSKNAIKGGISFLDNTIQAFEKLTDTIGAIPVLLTTVNTSMAALNKNYGITQLFNAQSHKIDVQGNFMGVDITAFKEQKKHFREASDAIRGWNSQLIAGTTDINTFGGAVVQNNAQLKAYLQTASTDAPASLAGYKAYLNAAGVSTDALRLKTVLLTSAMTLGLSLGMQAVISGISKLVNRGMEASQAIQDAVQETASAYKNVTSETESLEESLKELNEQINSLDPVTDSEDIENLKLETAELNAQLAILREKQKLAKEETDNAAQRALGVKQATRYGETEEQEQYMITDGSNTVNLVAPVTTLTTRQVTGYEELENAMDAYKEYEQQLKELNEEYSKMNEADKGYSQKAQEILDLSAKMDEARAHANELAVSIQEQAEGLSGDTEAGKELKDAIDLVLNEYIAFTDAITTSTDALNANAEALNNVSETQLSMEQLNENINTTLDSIQKSYDALEEFKSAMSEGMTDSALDAVAGLSDELKALVAEFYAGTVSADELFQALTDHYNNDLKNYGDAIIAKNELNAEFYNTIGLNDTEFVNHMSDNYGVDIKNCKTYAEAKLAIEQQSCRPCNTELRQCFQCV